MPPAGDVTTRANRLPDDTRLGAVRLQVSDLSRSIEYYKQVVGLAVLSQAGSDAMLGEPTRSTPLVALRERAGAQPVSRHGRLGLYHFALLLPDRASLGRFIAHLADASAHAVTADHAVSEAVYLWDPDGLGIEVYSDRPRGEWRYSGNEVYMTTQPLDVRGLVMDARGEPWIGVPAGTTLGHVHLHVGDLREADRFYHAALGLDRTVTSYPGALFLAAGGYHHHLGTNTWAAGAPPSTDADARLLEWTILLPTAADVETAARNCEAAGYDVKREADGWTAVDSWGTPLRVTQVRGT